MRSVTLKSAMTPSFMGLIATMLPGVRPSISLASLPTASTSPVFLLSATMEGSFTTMPLPLANTKVLAVPRSMARSEENRLKRERRFIKGYRCQEARCSKMLAHFRPFEGWLSRRAWLLGTAAALSCGRPKGKGFPGYALVANAGERAVAAVDLTVFAVVRQIGLE